MGLGASHMRMLSISAMLPTTTRPTSARIHHGRARTRATRKARTRNEMRMRWSNPWRTLRTLLERKLYDAITNHYIAELCSYGPFPRQLLLNVDGVAGSGKTYTLLKACARLQELASDAGLPNPVFRAAPTGIAAFNFTGKTVHSLLRLPVKGKTADLSTGTLQALQALFQACRFLIIDEKSMIDLKMLSLIDTRLRAICPQNDQPFGGINVLLCVLEISQDV